VRVRLCSVLDGPARVKVSGTRDGELAQHMFCPFLAFSFLFSILFSLFYFIFKF
jgi:hypothetical protein